MPGPAWERIQREEAEDYARARTDARRVDAVMDHKGLAAFGTVAAGALLGLLVWPVAWLRYGREPDVPGVPANCGRAHQGGGSLAKGACLD